jgi:tetratricopeptide (TPR) repeat protein
MTFMAPQVWEEITAAQRDAAANPTSPESHLRLAYALEAALSFKGGLLRIGNSVVLAESAKAAYERALELTPDDVTIYIEYLNLLWNCTDYYDSLPENYMPTLRRALELAPTDERLLRIQDMVVEKESFLDRRSETAMPIDTPVPMPPPEPTLKPTRIPSTTPALVTIQSPVTAPSPTPAPALALSDSPVATPIALPSQDGGRIGMTPLLALGAALGVLLVGWRVVAWRSKR